MHIMFDFCHILQIGPSKFYTLNPYIRFRFWNKHCTSNPSHFCTKRTEAYTPSLTHSLPFILPQFILQPPSFTPTTVHHLGTPSYIISNKPFYIRILVGVVFFSKFDNKPVHLRSILHDHFSV